MENWRMNAFRWSQAYSDNFERIFGEKDGDNKKTTDKIRPFKPSEGNRFSLGDKRTSIAEGDQIKDTDSIVKNGDKTAQRDSGVFGRYEIYGHEPPEV